MTPEQMRKRIAIREAVAAREAQTSEQPAPTAPAAPEQNAAGGGAMDFLKGQVKESLPGQVYGGFQNLRQGKPADSVVGQMMAGGAKTGSDVATGARQVFNMATGDDEELATLKAGEDERRAKLEALIGDKYGGVPGMVGQVGAAVAPALLAGAGAPVGLGMRVLAGMGAGGAGGFAQPVNEEESRGLNTLAGATLGGAVPTAPSLLRGGKEFVRKAKRLLPEEAAAKLGRDMGYQGETLPLARELRNQVSGAADSVKKKFDTLYANVEGQKLPKAELTNTNAALSQIKDLGGQISEVKAPRLHKILNGVEEATGAKATGLLDAQGNPIMSSPQFTFKEARSARKELMALQRRVPPEDKVRVGNVIAKLDEDLAAWEKKVGTTAHTEARAIDEAYKEELLPYGKDAVGRYLRSATGGPKGLMREGTVAEDALARVPGARAPMRGLVGSELVENTPAAQARALTSGAAEAVMTAQERAYAQQLAQALRSGEDQTIINKLLSRVPKNIVNRVLAGVEEMGYTAPTAPGLNRTTAVAAGLGGTDF